MSVRTRLWLPVLMLAAAGCGGSGGGVSSGTGQCVAVLEFEGRSYVGQSAKVAPWARGPELGGAVLPSCDDGNGPGAGPDEKVTVVELVEVPSDLAVAVTYSEDVVFVREGTDITDAALPARLRELLGQQ